MEDTAAVGVGAVLAQGLAGYLITIIVALATAGMIAVVVRTLGAMHKEPPKPAVATPAVTPTIDEDEIARRVAVVAAAVQMAAGKTRIVQIGEAAIPGSWRTTGRSIHHGSHRPHH